MSQFLALKEYEVLANLQYKESDLLRGRQALLDLASFMERMETEGKVSAPVRKGIELDRGITYMRLALLEEMAGRKDISQDYLRQAQSILRAIDMKDVSEDHLREVVAKFDATPHYVLPYVLTFRMNMR